MAASETDLSTSADISADSSKKLFVKVTELFRSKKDDSRPVRHEILKTWKICLNIGKEMKEGLSTTHLNIYSTSVQLLSNSNEYRLYSLFCFKV